ncbi:MAG: carotenoid biosynthesis protein [Candidatus Absconditabacterales bacterium]
MTRIAKTIILACIFLSAFFPVHFGFSAQNQLIGMLLTMAFGLSCFIPFVNDLGKRGLLVIVIVGLFGYGIESLGVLTCFPYGCFAYSDQLGPKIAGIVPWMLLFTWPPLVIGVWSRLQSRISGYMLWLYGGLLLVAVDLILDPLAVLMGLRVYPEGGMRFGVPWTNFAGWLLSGTIGVMMIDKLMGKVTSKYIYDRSILLFLSFFVGYAFFYRVLP